MNLLRRWRDLTPSRRRLLPGAVLVLATFRVLLLLCPFRAVWRLAERLGRRTGTQGTATGRDVRWAVAAAARRLPGTTCLPQALAVYVLLRRYGLPAELRLGVARPADGPLTAHAWVESGGVALTAGEDVGIYSRFGPLEGVGR